MTDRDDINSGVLFKNKDKKESTHADYNGNADIRGEKFWLDAWNNKTADGAFSHISLRMKVKEGAEVGNTKHQGRLEKNDKGDNPKRPDYKGELNFRNETIEVAVWVRESKNNGDKFMSLLFKASAQAPSQPQQAPDSFDDDIPF